VDALPPYRARIRPEWIDYNGHLRDAYYGLVLSLAIDDVMDHLGLDSRYRESTRCTLYTLESHLHYLHEVAESDELSVHTAVLDADAKRIHAGCRFTRRDAAAGDPAAGAPAVSNDETVATGEVMLLHVRQGDRPASAPFPPEIMRQLDSLRLTADAAAAWGPKSRKIEVMRRPG
jgi:acyl-CoA thioester hydrolase